MKIGKLVAVCMITLLTMLSCKKQETNVVTVLNAADLNFIHLAGINNYYGRETAKAAIAKSSDSVVLSFARYLLTEHMQAQNDLNIMGTIVGFTVTDTTDAAHATDLAQINTLSGRNFDSTFIHTRFTDKQSTLTFYREELMNGSQVNVTHYANAYLQKFVADYQRADSIAKAFY